MCRRRVLELPTAQPSSALARETAATGGPASRPTTIAPEPPKDAPVEPYERARSVMRAELVGFLDTVIEYVREEDPGFAQLFADMLQGYIVQLATLSQQADGQRSVDSGV